MLAKVDAAARPVVGQGLAMLKRPVTSSRFRRVTARHAAPLKIIVGGSRTKRPGWISTDIHWRAAYYLDLLKPWPVTPDSVHYVLADNVIEHFRLPRGRKVLRHAFEAMAPGGRIRILTPDAERNARIYLEGGELCQRALERHQRHGYEAHYPVDLLRVAFSECGHHEGFIYDFETLRKELEEVGFAGVVRCQPGHSDDLELAGVDERVSDTDAALSLVVEAKKP